MIGRVALIGGSMNEAARIAIHAAKHRHQWGRYATVAYCANRGVPRRLLTLAVQLLVVDRYYRREIQ